MFDRVIFHIDVNSAFLSWEAVYRLQVLGGTVDLRDQICAVGGDAASRRGIHKSEEIWSADRRKHSGGTEKMSLPGAGSSELPSVPEMFPGVSEDFKGIFSLRGTIFHR